MFKNELELRNKYCPEKECNRHNREAGFGCHNIRTFSKYEPVNAKITKM